LDEGDPGKTEARMSGGRGGRVEENRKGRRWSHAVRETSRRL